jgi:ankyrin repeat protein
MLLVQDGRTPLWIASEAGHTTVVVALTAAGAGVNIVSKVCPRTNIL